MNNKTSINLLTLTAIFLAFPYAAQAAPITLPPTYNNSFYIYAYGDGASSNPTGTTSISQSASSIDPVNHPATATASLNVSASPFPTITASASATGTGTASVQGSLSYQFRIDDGSGIYDPQNPVYIPTIVTYKGSASASSSDPNYSGASSYFNIAGSNFAESYQVVVGASPSATHIVATCCGGILDPAFSGSTSFDVQKTYDMIANAFYRIDISATAVDTFDGFASAFIDPYIQIDPNFANKDLYHIELSPGISNVIPSVPLPAALPMFGAALLGLGFLGFRTKEKNGYSLLC